MKLTIKQIIPVSNHWNVYIGEQDNRGYCTIECKPVCGLALVQDFYSPEAETWKYIDTYDIEEQQYPEIREDLTFHCTMYSEGEPSMKDIKDLPTD